MNQRIFNSRRLFANHKKHYHEYFLFLVISPNNICAQIPCFNHINFHFTFCFQLSNQLDARPGALKIVLDPVELFINSY